MKSQISSVDLKYLLEEMKEVEGGRIDKIYHPSKEELIIQLHVTGKGKKVIRVMVGKFIFLTEEKGNYGMPSGFCMFLRKYLSNARLEKIEQVGCERICKIVFSTKEKEFVMYIELFGKGNIVLCDKEDIIINALEQKKWSDREIKKGVKYSFPEKEYDFSIKEKEFGKCIKGDKEIVYVIAKDIGLGGSYSEEICNDAGIDKKRKRLNGDEVKNLYKSFKKILGRKINAVIIYKNGKIKDVLPFKLSAYSELELKEFESFNKAFDELYRSEIASKIGFVSKHQKLIDKTQKIVESQDRQVKSLEKKADENTKKGELIYEKYQVIEEIIKEINKAREKYSFDEIKKRLKGHKTIKDVDGKEKKIVIEL